MQDSRGLRCGCEDGTVDRDHGAIRSTVDQVKISGFLHGGYMRDHGSADSEVCRKGLIHDVSAGQIDSKHRAAMKQT